MNDRPDLALRRRRRRRARGPGRHAGRRGARARAGAADRPLHPLRRPARRRASRPGADQLSVGPVWETPTKPGRPAAGLELRAPRGRPAARGAVVRHRRDRRANVGEVVEAGAERIVVVRAIRDAADPRAAAAAAARRARRRPRWRSAVAASGASSASARRRPTPPAAEPTQTPRRARDAMARGYARGRAKDEAARAALKPLRRGRAPAGGDDGGRAWRWCSAWPTWCSTWPGYEIQRRAPRADRRAALHRPDARGRLGLLQRALLGGAGHAGAAGAASWCFSLLVIRAGEHRRAADRPGGDRLGRARCSGSWSSRWRGSRCPSGPAPTTVDRVGAQWRRASTTAS